MSGKLEVPKASAGDVAHTAVKVVAQLVPAFGGPAAELFNALVAPPLERRRNEWFREVAESIEELARRTDKTTDELVEELKANDAFVDTIYQASQAAIKTSEGDKLEALRNAVLNAALPNAPDSWKQQLFVSLVDSLTVPHIHVLKLLNDPRGWCAAHARRIKQPETVDALITDAFSGIDPSMNIFLCRDLSGRGLVPIRPLHEIGVSYSDHVLDSQHWTTPIADEFLAFIRKPT